MPWFDPTRQESDADRALRAELQELLGLPEGPPPKARPTAEQIALAEALRQEAERRRRVVPLRRRSYGLLVAASLPFALVALGLGIWGLNQKGRADALAQDLEHQRRSHEAQLIALRQELNRAQTNEKAPSTFQTARGSSPKPSPKGKELIIPTDPSPAPNLQGTVTVKDRR